MTIVPAHLLVDACTIRRRSDTYNVNTGSYDQGTTLVGSFECAVQNAGTSESRYDGSDRGVSRVVIFLPYGADVLSQDYLTVTTGLWDGTTFAVTMSPSDDAGRGCYTRVTGERIDGMVRP